MIPASVNSLLLSSGAAAYEIQRSLRFDATNSSYLSRTPSVAGTRRTWTWAGWVKRSALGTTRSLFGTTSGVEEGLVFSGDQLRFFTNASPTGLVTSAVFRDVSAWYHIVLAYDTTQSVASNRVKIYVNGAQVTTFATLVYPTLNYLSFFNNNNPIYIGATGVNRNVFDGYIADVYFIDGEALEAGRFGQYDLYGVWQPKRYFGSYGTNGFHLDFADNGAATASQLGKDVSENNNNWTPNNFSVAAGRENDSLFDSPTRSGIDTGLGAEVSGNYATFNPLHNGGIIYDKGNTEMLAVSYFYWETAVTTLAVKSKTYVEFEVGNAYGIILGLIRTVTPPRTGSTPGYNSPIGSSGWAAGSFGYEGWSGICYVNGVSVFTASSYFYPDIIGVAFDPNTGNVYLWKNGVVQNSGNPVYTLDSNFSYHFAISEYDYSDFHAINTGQRPFYYPAPTGYKALCSTNIPAIAPEITKGAASMDVQLYTGNSSTQSFSEFDFSPGLVWIKSRSDSANHALYDVARGAQARLAANTTAAEVASDNGLTSFDSNGFTLGSLPNVNFLNATFAAWAWNAGASSASNTDGTITSTVRANANAGFSIVTYTGNGTFGATIGHGLGIKPSLIIVKNQSIGNWAVHHSSLAITSYLYLNSTDIPSSTPNLWANTTPSSSVFSVGSNFNVNQSGSGHVAYCFSLIDGYTSAGVYSGNGSTSGTFVFTNMKPRWILIKRTDITSNWIIVDNLRDGYNVDNDALFANLPDIESSTDLLDIVSNGFKLRTADASVNATNGSYIYFAIAEHPFSIARAR